MKKERELALSKRALYINKDLYYYYIFLIAGILFIYSTTRAEGFLLINRLHSDFFDTIMPVITYLGDGLVAALIALLFVFYKIRYAVFLLLSYALSGITSQLMKRLVFHDSPRPLAYFNNLGIDIYTLDNIDIPMRYSFPSGHATTAFALFIGITFLVKSWYLKLIFLLLAAMVGFSRVYLAMHFPVDVIAGSLLGVLFSYICFIWVSGWKKDWLDVSLSSRIIKQKG